MTLTMQIIKLVCAHPEGLSKRQIAEMLGAYPTTVNTIVAMLAKQKRLVVSDCIDPAHPRANLYVAGPHIHERWVRGKWLTSDGENE